MTLVLSKRSALVWAAKKAISDAPYDWDDEISWVLHNEERFRGIGRDRSHAVIHAARTESLHMDLSKYLGDDGVINWSDVLNDIHHGCMSEFIETPYGVLFMDCG